MQSFKFLTSNVPDEPEHIEFERFRPQLTEATRILRMNINRNDIGEEQFYQMLRQERTRFMEDLWRNQYVRQEIIYQDEFGFTLRTELNN